MASFSKENLNFKFGEGTLHTSNSSLSFETVNLKNIDCNEVNPDVLNHEPNFVPNVLFTLNRTTHTRYYPSCVVRFNVNFLVMEGKKMQK